MRPEDLRQLLQRQPCPLLCLHLTNGVVFEIRDPDEAVVTRSTVEFLVPQHESREREAVINLLHIIWVEVLMPPA